MPARRPLICAAAFALLACAGRPSAEEPPVTPDAAPPEASPDAGPDAAAPPARTVRVATFNAALNRPEAGALAAELTAGSAQARAVAEIIQRAAPDVLLLQEFDHDPAALDHFRAAYLAVSQSGADPIDYPYVFAPPSNTGEPSGLDLDGDGEVGGPGDAHGFGQFPGQYAFAILSRFPIDEAAVRTLQTLRWAAMPDARVPTLPESGAPFYPEAGWQALRLSSKNHVDVPIRVDGRVLHLVAAHPTPPVFDGPEDRNGKRNHDEIRFWVDYVSQGDGEYIYDDDGRQGGIGRSATWIVAGDLNADPVDGDAIDAAIEELANSNRANRKCIPSSAGALAASRSQGGMNARHRGNPRHDTADFNDEYSGNLRVDYLLTARRTDVVGCGVFWPAPDEPGADQVGFTDHHLVWMDVEL